jgi:hypothetical protein
VANRLKVAKVTLIEMTNGLIDVCVGIDLRRFGGVYCDRSTEESGVRYIG